MKAAGDALALDVLRYGVPQVVKVAGWTGDVKMYPDRMIRGGGIGASGAMTNGTLTLEVGSVDVAPTDKPGRFEISIHDRLGRVRSIVGVVSVAMAVVMFDDAEAGQ